ncbi:MAG: outer membrane beta-barrel protein [Paraprevotella clara]
MNVSGAYSATARFDISANIGEKRYWTWQMNADANYDHSVDHAMLAGETESHVNAVNTTVLHDGTYIQYNKDAFNIRASGDIRWRHSEGRMRDFETLDALDFNYGLSARYTLPRIKTTLSADATMYSRRGYGSAELNTDDFVLNASLSQPFWKGKLIARIEAFDLLHQVSSTQYSVNAQGRTETWFRSLPHYVMLHLVYHWNRNPKKP